MEEKKGRASRRKICGKSRSFNWEGNMEEFIPFDKCPKCGSKNLIKFDELRDGMGGEEMTDGQLAEYEVGNWGTVICCDCGETIYYD